MRPGSTSSYLNWNIPMNASLLLLLPYLTVAAEPAIESKSRTFRFNYTATVTGLEAKQAVRIWLPFPSNSSDQSVELIEQDLPGASRLESEARFGNRILYVEAQANADGAVPVKLVYRVTRREVHAGLSQPTRAEAELFLKEDAKVPLQGRHLRLLDGKKLPEDSLSMSRALFDIVNAELRYSKEGNGWGQGDVNWVCDSKYGNCTDFHSLFIGLVRSRNLPGKFEIGFPLPAKRGSGPIAGYHCWAKVYVEGKGWVPVDISMANQNPKLTDYCFGNLSEDRITFSEGRDIVLVPKQNGPPLNYFVYPYVEVGGKAWPAEKIERKFAFEDANGK
jgi:Transglutaminase-like superfamily